MKIIVTGKNINVSDKIQSAIEKKFEKFGRYFADDIKANVVIHPEKAKVKMETTIVARNTIFRAENVSQDVFDCIDIVADKLMKQISKYKDKMIKKNKSNESVRFEMIPEPEEQEIPSYTYDCGRSYSADGYATARFLRIPQRRDRQRKRGLRESGRRLRRFGYDLLR